MGLVPQRNFYRGDGAAAWKDVSLVWNKLVIVIRDERISCDGMEVIWRKVHR